MGKRTGLAMKILAMYLPQFHRVEENDKWWGEGYTEWTATREAEAYYEGHRQPRRPLDGNYYDLLEKDTMKWQADLMHQYGIDGMCMYHYWFKDGKRLLEKPVENLLQWTDIDMPFCLYWDNQSWIRSWSKREQGNIWASKLETKFSEEETEILMEQDFGQQEQWKEHFEYLLPFFRDERYIKIDNCPIFLIYHVAKVECVYEMVAKWNQWAQEEGFNGVYFIGAFANTYAKKCVNAILMHEPANVYAKVRFSTNSGIQTYSYDDAWQAILDCERRNEKVYYSGVVGFDDTPRRGRKGRVIEGQTPQKFEAYLAELLAKNEVAGNEFTFLNAWNEWGEGMYLEPDENDGYRYLEAVRNAKSNYKNYISKYEKQRALAGEKESEYIHELEEKNEKLRYINSMLSQWWELERFGNGIVRYFEDHHFGNVAVYGLGVLGKKLISELLYANIDVAFVVDRLQKKIAENIPVYQLEDALPDTDVIVLTMADAYYLEKEVKRITNRNVVTLEEIISELTK